MFKIKENKSWENAQHWEKNWWGNCTNTYGEEEKQLLYAHRMGLVSYHNSKSPYNFDLDNKSILDVGGGPVSLLLKCDNFLNAKVADPLNIPYWVIERYNLSGIEYQQIAGEVIKEKNWDEVWIYNVLQHTSNPEKIIENCKQAGKIIRVFEWINTHINEGHPHSFTKETLDKLFCGYGRTEKLTGQANCYGDCYYGVFLGRVINNLVS